MRFCNTVGKDQEDKVIDSRGQKGIWNRQKKKRRSSNVWCGCKLKNWKRGYSKEKEEKKSMGVHPARWNTTQRGLRQGSSCRQKEAIHGRAFDIRLGSKKYEKGKEKAGVLSEKKRAGEGVRKLREEQRNWETHLIRKTGDIGTAGRWGMWCEGGNKEN